MQVKDLSCQIQTVKLLKAQLPSGIFSYSCIREFWYQSPQPSQVHLPLTHHSQFQLTECLQHKQQLAIIFNNAQKWKVPQHSDVQFGPEA